MKAQLLIICVFIQVTTHAQTRQLNSMFYNQEATSVSTASTHNVNSSNGRVMSLCSDKVNYVGNIGGTGTQCGGVDAYAPFIFFQAFPGYAGEITRVDFYASKIASNVNAKVKIWELDINGYPTGGFIASANVLVSGLWAEYGATFSTPVTVGSYGFAAAVEAPLPTDSLLVLESCCNFFFNQSYQYDVINGLQNFSGAKDLIIRPTIRFSMPTLGLNVNPQPACVSGSTSFTGNITPANLPAQFGNPLFNSVYSFKVNFGDGSPLSTLNPGSNVNHSYATAGSKNLTYNLEYVGWSSTCNETYTSTLAVNSSSVSSFSYGTTNLLLTVINNSIGANGYSWNFGDLTTSNLQNPPVHDYSLTQGAGTYVVELTTTSPCGNGFQAKTITVQQGTSTGLNETEFDESIFVYPNPATSTVTIDYEFLKSQERIEIFIMDAFGKIVKTKGVGDLVKGSILFDVNDLDSGTYFIKLSSDNRNVVRTFIKQ
ncbi:MAG: T9SS type A sorting domain-containing protein [Bacteroidia bacterium]